MSENIGLCKTCDDGCNECMCCPCPGKSRCFVGQPAPFFKAEALMMDGTFKEIKLDDYLGKWVVIFFYPMDFTFVCPTEIISFSNHAEEFSKLNCDLIGASCDSVYSHLAWTKVGRTTGGIGKMNIPLISDKTLQISRDYNILIEEKGISLRGIFIIDPKGILRQIIVNDLAVGRSVDEILRLVKAYQFTDVYGEVCPMNWHPGSETIKPEKHTEFFEKEYANK